MLQTAESTTVKTCGDCYGASSEKMKYDITKMYKYILWRMFIQLIKFTL